MSRGYRNEPSVPPCLRSVIAHLMIRRFVGGAGGAVRPACVTLTDLPAMVSVVVRAVEVELRAAV